MLVLFCRPLLKLYILGYGLVKLVSRGVVAVKYSIQRRCVTWLLPPLPHQERVGLLEQVMVEDRVTRLEKISDFSSARKRLESLLDSNAPQITPKRVKQDGKTAKLEYEPDGKFGVPGVATSEVATAGVATSEVERDGKFGVDGRRFEPLESVECEIPNFQPVWNAIVEMRNRTDAPVDRMGAHCLADRSANKDVFEFQTLIACMLSSQTKDAVTAAAMDNLKQRGLSLENVLEMPEEELDSLISKVGFHKTKARHIKEAAVMLKDRFAGRVPQSVEELVELPGVGRKMANLVMQLAFGKVEGIAVDVHVHRIANRLGWVRTKTPEETRVKLESLLPRSLWAEVNHLLVGFGQTICIAAGPGCSTCAANKWCPTGISVLERAK